MAPSRTGKKPSRKTARAVTKSAAGKSSAARKSSAGKTSIKKAAKTSPAARTNAKPGKTASAKAKSITSKTAKAKSVKTNRPAAAKPSAGKASSGVVSAEKKPSRGRLSPREREILEIRRTLMEQKDSILSEAESTMNSLPEQTVFPDLGDQATAESDRNFILRLRSREQRLLTKIEEAVERIDGGTFGICDVCGEEIGLERLRARPVATLCIHCKEEQEEEEKLQGL